MCQALSGMIGSAEAQRSDASKDELHPCGDRHSLANEAMCFDHHFAHLPMYALFKVEFQIDSHGDLGDQHEHDVRNELGVNVLGKLSSLVLVAEEVSYDSEKGAEGLYGNVQFGADYLGLLVVFPWAVFLYTHS